MPSASELAVRAIPVAALALFVVLMVWLGVANRRGGSGEVHNFLLGGRNIGPWMSAFAYGTTYFSAVIFIGYAGKTGWGIGLGGVWIGIGNAVIGSALAWLLLARRTRAMTHNLNAATMPEFFGARYQSTPLKGFSACVAFVFLLPYAASVYMGLGYLFSAVFPGINITYCMLLIAVLTAVYLVLGGYKATAVTNFVQGLIMIAGVVALTAAVLANPAVGGLSEGIARLRAIPEVGEDLAAPFGGANWQPLFWLLTLTSLGTWGLPQMVHKFYAVRDGKAIRQATVISTAFAAVIGAGAYFVGSFGRLFMEDVPPEGFDKIIPDMLVRVLSDGWPAAVLLSVILLVVLSASMSTLSAVVMSAGSAVSVDLIGIFRPNLKERTRVALLRGFCLLFVALSFLFAQMRISFIISLMAFSWGAVSGCFIGPYLWGLFWKRTTRAGAAAGMAAGLLVMGGLVLAYTLRGGFAAATASSPMLGTLAMLASLAVVPVVSLVTKPADKAVVARAFGGAGS